MNGIHDCGGRHGYGPIDIDPEQPIFHADWERRMFGMFILAFGGGHFNIDQFRSAIEQMRPAEYLESTDFVEEPSVLAPALGICGDVSEANSWLFASCGEDGRRDRNELRQLSEVLGGGGQQELIFGSTRPTQAQSIQPEDALQMSEEHLDLLSFAT